MTTKIRPVLLVDGSSYLYRAFHALPALTNSRGEPTGAVYGVINMLRKLLAQYQPQFAAVVFDAKGKTFRDDLYAEYKAHRPPMPEELKAQIAPLHAIVQAMGLPLLCIEGVEADDVIGTLARRAVEHGLDVVISTGDKDIAQLVDEHITLINTMNDSVLDRAGVIEKFGVAPERMVDYLALVGDTSDNVPGVPKVGPKTAVKWLASYGDLDNIIARAAEFDGKIGENLRAHLAMLPLTRQLVTIKCDVDLNFQPEDLRIRAADPAALRELFQHQEFRTWLKETLDQKSADEKSVSAVDAVTSADTATAHYECVLTNADLAIWLQRLRAAPLFAFDTETTSLDYMQAHIVGVSFAVEAHHAAYVPLAHRNTSGQLPREAVLAQLKPILEDPARLKVGQNLKYDMSVLVNHGIHLRGIAHDTMLQSYVLDSTATRHDMDSLALKYLGYKTVTYEEVAGKGAKQIGFDDVDIETATRYAAEDADVTLRLHQALWPSLEKLATLRALYSDIEMPLVPVLSRMERLGVLIDADLLYIQSGELARKIIEIEQRAHNLAGHSFNLSSPKQIQEIFFVKLGLPVLEKTPTGQPSTAESVLQELAENYELPRVILEHRGLSKLLSTYVDKLPLLIDKNSGRVHTSYHQAVAATGRLSSSDPNLQNIPIRTPEGRRIRQAFIAPPGYRIMSADYSQIELRIMAHLSGDAGLCRAFASGQDVHKRTAAEVFGVPLDGVGDEQRRHAKAINFGLIYGMSAFGLARQLGVTREAAQDYMNLYFARYPGVKDYMEGTRATARKQGYVETLFGRRLYLPDIKASNAQRRQYAERTAINAPMQGTAADIIKRAMLTCDLWLQGSHAPARMIMQVHDELVFEVAEDAVASVTQQVRDLMVAAAELRVPLVVDVGVGDNWDEAH
ncbi:MAG: DNA polymerase I [Pseudomonadota bacterium]